MSDPCHSVRIVNAFQNIVHTLVNGKFEGLRSVPGRNMYPERFLSSEPGRYNGEKIH